MLGESIRRDQNVYVANVWSRPHMQACAAMQDTEKLTTFESLRVGDKERVAGADMVEMV